MSKKAKKIINIVVNVIIGIIIVLILLLAINMIASHNKGYTSIFGKAYLVVQTDSMKGDGEDNFEAGDLIVIKVLDDDEKTQLQEGQIITFYDYNISKEVTSLNSHRIQQVNGSGTSVTYTTKGDNVDYEDIYTVSAANVIGTFESNWGKIGKVVSWFSSSTGFFVCVVLPSFLIVVYFAVNLIMVIREGKRQKAVEGGEVAEMTADELEQYKAAERERLKAEMQEQVKAEMQEKVKAEMQAEMKQQIKDELMAEIQAEQDKNDKE